VTGEPFSSAYTVNLRHDYSVFGVVAEVQPSCFYGFRFRKANSESQSINGSKAILAEFAKKQMFFKLGQGRFEQSAECVAVEHIFAGVVRNESGGHKKIVRPRHDCSQKFFALIFRNTFHAATSC